MKVLVIGSKGFIGSHLSRYLEKSPDFDVFECDVTVDYGRTNYFLIDATNADYQSVFKQEQFDACINCSGAASVGDSLSNPIRDFSLNAGNVYRILDAIRVNQPECRFLNLSSAAVYGNPELLPIHERQSTNPISPYGIHKMQAEQICRLFSTYYGIRTCSLRIFSAYGPGLKKQLFWDVYQKAKKSDVVSLFGTGAETRDFIYIDDVVTAILCCLRNTAYQGEAINLANGEEITILEAVETLLDFFPTHKQAMFNGAVKTGDPVNWRADISLLSEMGYQKSATLHDGLNEYYSWIAHQ